MLPLPPVRCPMPSLPEPDRERMLGQVEELLRDVLTDLEPEPGDVRRGVPGRPRILPGLCLWAGLVVCVLRGFTSQLSVWRLVSQVGLWFYPRALVTDQAVYDRLGSGGTAVLERLFGQLSALLRARLAPYAETTLAPFATEVAALDESTLDAVARTLPALRAVPNGDARLLPGKLTGLFDLRRQQWRAVEHQADPHQNEKVAARGMLDRLPAWSLVLADLGYFGFAWFDALTDRHFWWISRLRKKTSFTVIHAFYDDGTTFDGLVWLGAHRADRAKHAVRLVSFRVGQTTFRYLTNVTDPRVLPIVEIARLYARRWDIEVACLLIKRHLNLHLLWSAKDGIILQQVWAVLIIAQLLQALRLEIAGRAGVDPFDVSLALLVQYLPHFAATGQDPVACFIERGRAAGFIRPSTRTRIQAPAIPRDQFIWPPPDLVLVRTPRYAHRKTRPRTTTSAVA